MEYRIMAMGLGVMLTVGCGISAAIGQQVELFLRDPYAADLNAPDSLVTEFDADGSAPDAQFVVVGPAGAWVQLHVHPFVHDFNNPTGNPKVNQILTEWGSGLAKPSDATATVVNLLPGLTFDASSAELWQDPDSVAGLVVEAIYGPTSSYHSDHVKGTAQGITLGTVADPGAGPDQRLWNAYNAVWNSVSLNDELRKWIAGISPKGTGGRNFSMERVFDEAVLAVDPALKSFLSSDELTNAKQNGLVHMYIQPIAFFDAFGPPLPSTLEFDIYIPGLLGLDESTPLLPLSVIGPSCVVHLGARLPAVSWPDRPFDAAASDAELLLTMEGIMPPVTINTSVAGTRVNLSAEFHDTGRVRASLPDWIQPGDTMTILSVTNAEGTTGVGESIVVE